MLEAKRLRVAAEFRHSARQVKCCLRNGYHQRTAFWLEKTAPGVADADDEPGSLGADAHTHAIEHSRARMSATCMEILW